MGERAYSIVKAVSAASIILLTYCSIFPPRSPYCVAATWSRRSAYRGCCESLHPALPTSYSRSDLLTTSYSRSDLLPTSYSRSELLPASYSRSDLLTTSYSRSGLIPNSYIRSDLLPTS